jgi:membrane fusion protein, copper/silver efflux system
MTKKRLLLSWVLVLSGAGGLLAAGARSAHRPASAEPSSASANATAASAPRRVLYYVDPMHPAYKSDKPGTAPDCGMQLVAVYADDKPAADMKHSMGGMQASTEAVHVTAAQQQLIGVKVDTVQTAEVHPTVRLYGRVVPDESRVYRVNVGIEGVVKDLSALTTGSQVAKGQWLVSFSAPDARATVQAYMVALEAADRSRKAGDDQSQMGYLQSGIRQTRDRLYNIGMAQDQLDEINRTRVEPAEIRLAAPAAGFILARNVTAGERFDRGMELYRIADLRHVWITADVFGVNAEYVHPGMAAEVTIPGRATALKATVSSSILPEFDPATQSLKVRLEADNPGFALRPDMYVDVHLAIALPSALAVPSDAVLDAGTQKRVFVETADGVFEPRAVETGWRFGDRVQILKGLQDGDRIVTSGTFLFDSESRMRHTDGAQGSR